MRSDVPHRKVFVRLGFVTLALLGGARAAYAQTTPTPNCNDTTMFPNPIYLTGSTAFEPTASQIAVRLAAQTTPHTLIYTTGTVSCDGYARLQNNTPLTGNGHHYVLATDGVTVTTLNCVLDPAGVTTTADVGVADVFFEWCPGNAGMTLPSTLGNFVGPIQAMQFIVPEANVTVTALSAEQAQDIWGCGTTSGVSPFIDTTAIQQRGPASGTQIMVSRYIGVPADMFQGNGFGPTMPTGVSGGQLVTNLLAVASNASAIGFLASDAYDARRSTLNALAFKGFGQKKAYYADSDPSMADKQNVRDGHYMIFGPEHFIAPVDSAGAASGNAKLLIDWVQGTTPIEAGKPQGYIDIEGAAGMVPQCAMKVTRDTDGGPLKPYKPKVSCGCYFQMVVNKMTPANCTPCTDDSACVAGVTTCQNQFCETK